MYFAAGGNGAFASVRITAQKENQRQLEHIAHYDVLNGTTERHAGDNWNAVSSC